MSKKLISLKLKAEAKTGDVSKVTTFAINPFLVKFEPGFNGREINQAHVDSLVQTRLEGLPWDDIWVRVDADETTICVDGHHRVLAGQKIRADGLLKDLDGKEFVIGARQFRGDDADRIFLMLTSQQGLKMTPLELSIQYKKLIALGNNASTIARRSGVSPATVSQLLSLADANTDVKNLVADNVVGAHTAIAAVKRHGTKAGAVIKSHLRDGKKTVVLSDINPKPMTLDESIRIEMKSNGLIRAEDTTPQFADEIAYLRASAK